ncbi:MFS transporter [Mycolicibacterium hodleri]|uniref:MFS transporter n=1 Tax=Mycolicibacterium hodleri TaxID=49897 RepID=A0A502DWZ7_9MYCO|nr:MFS transporter [Mycolicibacterium hodleri]TPG29624.1 MFS transporter [Mycolicibacterium hodleri]
MTLSRANRQRALVALVEVLGLSVWFSATAVVPSLRAEWGISSAAAVWLTASVQIGFVVGAVASAVLNLADRTPPRLLLAASALCAATCTAVLALFANGLAAAVPLRFLTGTFLAGVYPVGMKLAASWSRPVDRGRTFGILLGALTIGSALPHLISGLGQLPWRTVMLAAAALTAVAAIVAVTLIRPGPQLEIGAITPHPRHAMAIFVHRGPRLVSLGYFGHMWELYALWTWLAMFVAAGRAQRGDTAAPSTGLIVFVAIGVAGAAGCLLGGWASDYFGRPPAAIAALVISGACCAASPVFFAAPTAVLTVFLLVWGAAVIADSGVFSTSLSETTDPRYVGTALTAQPAVGFLVTVVTIQLVPLVAGLIGWQYAFLLLTTGPLIGAAAMCVLRAAEHQPHPSKESHEQEFNAHEPIRRSDGGTLAHRR